MAYLVFCFQESSQLSKTFTWMFIFTKYSSF